MEPVDLFGHTDCAPTPARRSAPRKEVFDLSQDFSRGERLIIAGHLIAHAHKHAFGRKADALRMEADRYSYCGQQAILKTCDREQKDFWIKTWCRSRICEHCGRIYRKAMKDKLDPILQKLWNKKREGFTLAMVTLTVTSKRFGHDPEENKNLDLLPDSAPTRWGTDLPTREDLERLYRETSTFFRLYYGKHKAALSPDGKVVEVRKKLTSDEKAYRRRQRREAKQRGEPKPEFPKVDRRIPIGCGWIAALEVGADNNNAHCHALIYGPFRKWLTLQQKWQKITGDSTGCHIKKVKSVKDASDYVLKYITKPPVTESYTRVADYAVMIKGTRRIRSGGIFYGVCTLDKPEHKECRCPSCGDWLRLKGIVQVDQVGNALELYAEVRRIEKEKPAGTFLDLPDNFLPRGVTPVYMPQWQGHC